MTGFITKLLSKVASPCLLDRKTGQRIYEPMPMFYAVREWLLYRTWIGQLLLSLPITWWFLTIQHQRIARYADSEKSKKDIPGLIKTFQIDETAAEKPVEQYKTLQEFFTRRLRPGLRPVAQPDNPAHAVSPADSRCVVYPTVDAAHRFWIKGVCFSVCKLMGPGYDTQDHWEHAAIAINRLSPSDLHRLHASVTGTVKKIARRGDKFMASEYAAVHSHMNSMCENERLVMEFETEAFGPVVQVMIGASDVGTVKPLVKEGQAVRKGDEVAVFEYGGSIMATLFGSGTIAFDDDLSANSQNGAETLVTFGSSLGTATGHPRAHAPAGAQQHARKDEL